MAMSEWTVLQIWGTIPTTHQPTIIITVIYAKNKARIDLQCSLQIRNTCSTTIPTPITSNLWILTSTTELDSEGVTLICTIQVPKSIKVQKPIHVLCLPPAWSATSKHFHLPSCYDHHQIMINISLLTDNLNTMNIFHPWSVKYGNTLRIIGTIPSYINWLTYLQFLLLIYTNIWLSTMDQSTHSTKLMS